MKCKACNRKMKSAQQKLRNRQGEFTIELITCDNQACDLYGYTFDTQNYQQHSLRGLRAAGYRKLELAGG